MQNRRALIIDDDQANCSLWEHFLTDHGYDVVTAASLQDAQERWGADIDLYLVDYYLPDCYGTQAVAQIRQQFPDSLVFVVSMDDDADVIREAMRGRQPVHGQTDQYSGHD
jgi:CheY-like chemotaxis protein